MWFLNHSPARMGFEIVAAWKKPYFGAVPYIAALAGTPRWDVPYGLDPLEDIVARFLTNAATFRGDRAKAIKQVLNYRLDNDLFTAERLET